MPWSPKWCSSCKSSTFLHVICIVHVDARQCWTGTWDTDNDRERLLADSSLMEHTCLWCPGLQTHSDRAQLTGHNSQSHTAQCATFRLKTFKHFFKKPLSSHSLDWDGNISSVSPLQTHLSILSPPSDTFSSPLAVSLSSCVSERTERRLFCTVLTLRLISVCLPSLALFFPSETSRFSDLKPLGDLAGRGGSQRARLCVSLNHLANRAGQRHYREARWWWDARGQTVLITYWVKVFFACSLCLCV